MWEWRQNTYTRIHLPWHDVIPTPSCKTHLTQTSTYYVLEIGQVSSSRIHHHRLYSEKKKKREVSHYGTISRPVGRQPENVATDSVSAQPKPSYPGQIVPVDPY